MFDKNILALPGAERKLALPIDPLANKAQVPIILKSSPFRKWQSLYTEILSGTKPAFMLSLMSNSA